MYTGPDKLRYKAPVTYETKMAAEGFLLDVNRAIERGEWVPNWRHHRHDDAVVIALSSYARDWIKHRDVRPRTREEVREPPR